MDSRTPIVKVEARLGFNFKRGLSREHRAKKIPQTNNVLERIDIINQRFVDLDWNGICNSEDVRCAADDLFNELGPSLWPDFDEVNGPFPKWLLQPGRPDINNNNELAHLYRRHLFFSSQSDQPILAKHFYALIRLKIVHFHANHFSRRPTKDRRDEPLRSHAPAPTPETQEPEEDCHPSTPVSSILSSLSTTPEQDMQYRAGGTAQTIRAVPVQKLMGNTQSTLAQCNTDPQRSSTTQDLYGESRITLKLGRKGQEQRTPPMALPASTSGTASKSVINDLQKNTTPSNPLSGSSQVRNGKRKAANVDQLDIVKKARNMLEQLQETGATPACTSQSNGTLLQPYSTSQAPWHRSDRSDCANQGLPRDRTELSEQQNYSSGSASQTASHQISQGTDPMIPAQGLSRLEFLSALRADRVDRDHHQVPEAARSPGDIHQSNRIGDPRAIFAETGSAQPRPSQKPAAQDDTTKTANHSLAAEQSTAPKTAIGPEPTRSKEDPLSSVFLVLYLEGAVPTDDPIGCVTLADLETRDKLFAEVQAVLDDELDAGEVVCMIRVRRADGEAFPGPNILSMPITRGGKQDVWHPLVKRVLSQGIGEEGLRGYVKVKNVEEST